MTISGGGKCRVLEESARRGSARRVRPMPIATMPCSGSSTSPVPVMMSDALRSATASIASSRRRMRSERQSFASSTAERARLALVLLELRLEALEQRERVGGRPGKAGEHAIVVEPAHLARRGLDDDVAERHLPVAAERSPRRRAGPRESWCRERLPCPEDPAMARPAGRRRRERPLLRLLDEVAR